MFCSKFRAKIKSFLRKIEMEVFNHASIALSVTTGLKKFLTGTAGDILTVVIPGELDNLLKDKVVAALNYAIPLLDGFNDCSKEDSLERKLSCVVDFLKSKYPDAADALLMKLAALITNYLHGGKLQQHQYDVAAQIQYTLNK